MFRNAFVLGMVTAFAICHFSALVFPIPPNALYHALAALLFSILGVGLWFKWFYTSIGQGK